jgi:hypothetical protein
LTVPNDTAVDRDSVSKVSAGVRVADKLVGVALVNHGVSGTVTPPAPPIIADFRFRVEITLSKT